MNVVNIVGAVHPSDFKTSLPFFPKDALNLFILYFGHAVQHVETSITGTESMPPVVEAWSLNHWTARNSKDALNLKLLSVK